MTQRRVLNTSNAEIRLRSTPNIGPGDVGIVEDTDSVDWANVLSGVLERVEDMFPQSGDLNLYVNAKAAAPLLWDGVTDDSAKLQSLLDAYPAFKIVLPAGTGLIAAAQLRLSSGHWLQGQGPQRTIVKFADVAGNGICALGTEDATPDTLLNPTAIGDYTLTLNAGLGARWAIGDWVRLSDSAANSGTSFMTRVAFVAADVLTLDEPIPAVFPTATTTVNRANNYVHDVIVSDMTILVPWTGSPARLRAATFNQFRSCRFENVEFVATGQGGASAEVVPCQIFAGREAKVINCKADGFLTVSGQSGLGFYFLRANNSVICDSETTRNACGTTFSASPRGRIENNGFYGYHTASGVGNRSIKVLNQSNGTLVEGNKVVGVTSGGLTGIQVDDSSGVEIVGNTVENVQGAGINLTGGASGYTHHCTVANNKLSNVLQSATFTGAIVITGGTAAGGTDTGHVVTGNTIRSSNVGGAVSAHGVSIATSGNLVTHNMIEDVSGTGVLFSASTTRNILAYNKIGNTGSSAIDSSSSAGGNWIGPNVFTGSYVIPTYKVTDNVKYVEAMQSLTQTGGGTLAIDGNLGDFIVVTVNDGLAFTLGSPSARGQGARLYFLIFNNTAGAMGAMTLGASYKTTGAFTVPAAGKRRTLGPVICDSTNWYEMAAREAVDY